MTTAYKEDATTCSHASGRRSGSHGWLHDLRHLTPHRGLASRSRRHNLIGDPVAQNPAIYSVFPTSSHLNDPSFAAIYLGWYGWRMHELLGSLTDELLSILVGHELHAGDAIQPQLLHLIEETATFMRASENPSIDSLITHLIDAGIFRVTQSGEDVTIARTLTFAVLGWQTMLIEPDFGSYPSIELSIVDEMDGYRGQGQMVFRQDQSTCKRPLYQFLMGFGVLLPPAEFQPGGVSDPQDIYENPGSVQPEFFNASLLQCIGGITFKWVDSLSLHMELDQNLKILYLFRYPSFCAANAIAQHAPKQARGAIHAFGAPSSDSNLCASVDDISKLLQETVCSYRLLFGQSKQARSLFRSMRPFDDVAWQGHDTFLTELCGRKRCRMVSGEDRDSYNLARHFPMYSSKMITLDQYMSKRHAHTWRELWQDKRDSAQWFTFWAVLILGCIGVLLALIQVILQIVALAR